MNKLNAEWCRNHIESMKANGLSLLEEKYLQALEIALTVLEQKDVDSEALAVSREIMKIMYSPMPSGGSVQLMAQVQCLVIDAMKVARGDKSLSLQPQTDTTPQIDNDGWIDWKGNGPTIAILCKTVEVRFQDNDTDAGPSRHFYWGSNCGNRIIAYRVIENDGREG